MPAVAEQKGASYLAWRAKEDPAVFAEKFLGHRLWDRQREMLQAVAPPRARVAVKAGSGVSKTFAAAEVVLWWIAHDERAKAITTAPVFTQVKNVMWPEIHIAQSGGLLQFPQPSLTNLYVSPENFAVGVSTRRTDYMRGHHGKVLFVIDEATGVDEAIFEAVKSIRAAGDVRVLMLGNPTTIGGPYYEAFHDHSESWTTLTINAFDSPNLKPLLGGLDPYATPDAVLVAALQRHSEAVRVKAGEEWPMLVSAEWVLEQWEEGGKRGDDPHWDAYVMARFPTSPADALVHLDDLTRYAAVPLPTLTEEDLIHVGIDPAGPGEAETAFVARAGDHVLEVVAWPDSDPRGAVLAKLQEYGPKERLRVNVDEIGEGRLVLRALQDARYHVRGVNVGLAPYGMSKQDSEQQARRYRNLKAQLYWQLRLRSRDGKVRGLADKKAQKQLTTMRFRYNPRGQVEIESKEELAKRGLASPDRAEATMLAYAELPEPELPRVSVYTGALREGENGAPVKVAPEPAPDEPRGRRRRE